MGPGLTRADFSLVDEAKSYDTNAGRRMLSEHARKLKKEKKTIPAFLNKLVVFVWIKRLIKKQPHVHLFQPLYQW